METRQLTTYPEFFKNYSRAILEFRDWDDMCRSAYLFIRTGSVFAFLETGMLEKDSEVDAFEFVDYLISYFQADTEKVEFLIPICDELKSIRDGSKPD